MLHSKSYSVSQRSLFCNQQTVFPSSTSGQFSQFPDLCFLLSQANISMRFLKKVTLLTTFKAQYKRTSGCFNILIKVSIEL